MLVVLGMVLLFVGMIALYAFIAIFFPELVGIAGKKSKEVNDSHEEVSNQDTDD